MGHPDGAHTHGGGGFDLMPVAAVILAAAVASGIASAVAQLTWLLLVTLSVVVMAAAVIAVMVVRHRLRHPPGQRPGLLVQRYQPLQRPVQARTPAAAIEAPRQNHIHFHGVTAADVAAVLREQGGQP